MKPISFAVMLNDFSLKQWQEECLQLLAKEGFKPDLLIVNRSKTIYKQTFRQRLQYFLYNRIEKYIHRDLHRIKPYRPANIPVVYVNCKPHPYKSIFDNESVAAIKSYSFDFILRFGFNILSGEILTAAKQGIWSFHHNNPGLIRGGPPVFWEIFQRHHTAGFILQQLTEKLDAGLILEQGNVEMRDYAPHETYENLIRSSQFALRNAVIRLANNNLQKQSLTATAPIFKKPGNLDVLKFIRIVLQNRIRFYYSKYLQKPYWRAFAIAGNNAIEFVPPGNGQFTADIFPVSDTDFVLAEVYSFNTRKAKIGLYKTSGEFIRFIPLPKDLHFSFPFTIKNEGKLWFMPECPTQEKLKIYELSADFEIVNEHIILNQNLTDAVLFQHENIWYLLGTEQPYQQQNLKLFYSESLTGSFKPHPVNPVKMDVASARNAGRVFEKSGKLIRPVMDNSKEYGGKLRFFKIEIINPVQFKESEIEVKDIISGFQMVHTYNEMNGIIYFDKKYK